MKAIAPILLLLAIFGTAPAASARPAFATTIDFLDYVFMDPKAENLAAYPLEIYEERIRELSEAGIRKLYLRVNVCGLALYPSRVVPRYGEQGQWHWNMEETAQRLVRTLETYDPLAETIRLGHQYGMEVWAWESLWDDAASSFGMQDYSSQPEYADRIAEAGFHPLMDPFFRDFPQGYAMRNPVNLPDDAEIAAANAAVADRHIGRIVFVSDINRGAVSLPVDVRLYVSSDNRSYTPYTGAMRISATRRDNRNVLVFDGLDIAEPYVKWVPAAAVPKEHNWGFAVNRTDGASELYDTEGGRMPARWSVSAVTGKPETTALNFNQVMSTAWDYDAREAGVMAGIPPVTPAQRHYLGMAEFSVPAAMAHKLARFEELAVYGFDGYIFNIRTHSRVSDPADFGYNPETLTRYRQRFGAGTEILPAQLAEVRADALDEYLAGCKRLAGERPLWMTAFPQPASGNHYDQFAVPWHFRQWFESGSIDGVMLIGSDDIEAVKAQMPPGCKAGLGLFRELGFPPGGYDFASDVAALKQHSGIDEVELYESMILNFKPEMRTELLK